MSNLTDYDLLSRVIAQRAEVLDKLSKEFNSKMSEATEIQDRWVKIADEDMRDRRRLEELESVPTLSRQ